MYELKGINRKEETDYHGPFPKAVARNSPPAAPKDNFPLRRASTSFEVVGKSLLGIKPLLGNKLLSLDNEALLDNKVLLGNKRKASLGSFEEETESE